MITHSDDLSPLNTFKQNGKYASLLTKLTNPFEAYFEEADASASFLFIDSFRSLILFLAGLSNIAKSFFAFCSHISPVFCCYLVFREQF